MASIEPRPTPDGKPGYRVKVRLKSTPTLSATFSRLTDAKRWAQSTGAAIRDGRHFKNIAAKKHTVGELIDKYIADVLPTKPRNSRNQKKQLIWWKDELGTLLLADLTAGEIGQRRDKLLARKTRTGKTLSGATAVRYLAAFSHALSTAVKEWEWLDDNPMRKVRKPKESRGRVRTLSKTQVVALLDACKESKNLYLHCVTLPHEGDGGRA
jgi:integrase